MSSFEKLLSGYRVFKATTFKQQQDLVSHYIALGIKPTTLVVTSCSLQIPVSALTSSNPGELCIHRNIGGFVPPYTSGVHGSIAAIEYAVKELKVENVIVLGHTHCDGIHLLMDKAREDDLADPDDPMACWLHTMDEAKEAVREQLKKKSDEVQEHACEQEAILVSLKNLISYPFVAQRIEDNDLSIYGWHFDIESGLLRFFNPETKIFEPVE